MKMTSFALPLLALPALLSAQLTAERQTAVVAAYRSLSGPEIERHRIAHLPELRFVRIDVSPKIRSASFGHTTTLLIPAGTADRPTDPNLAKEFYVEYGRSTNRPGGDFGPFAVGQAPPARSPH